MPATLADKFELLADAGQIIQRRPSFELLIHFEITLQRRVFMGPISFGVCPVLGEQNRQNRKTKYKPDLSGGVRLASLAATIQSKGTTKHTKGTQCVVNPSESPRLVSRPLFSRA
ncbi:MAG: hypothetical protein HY736_20945 [Verrucomicrobia bacterium]|nr:hypothetical protein [Verrucomicrobiota bacterium]